MSAGIAFPDWLVEVVVWLAQVPASAWGVVWALMGCALVGGLLLGAAAVGLAWSVADSRRLDQALRAAAYGSAAGW